MTDADRLAAIRQELTRGDDLHANPRRLDVEFLLNQLDAALAARQQAEQERDLAKKIPSRWSEALDEFRARAEAAEQQVTALTQERDELIKINAGLTTEIMGVTHQLKETEGRLGIVEVEDGKIQGIRITPARDLEYERRVRAEENLRVATDQLAQMTQDRDELNRAARELLDEAKMQLSEKAGEVTALRAALERLNREFLAWQGNSNIAIDDGLLEALGDIDAALAGSRAPEEKPVP